MSSCMFLKWNRKFYSPGNETPLSILFIPYTDVLGQDCSNSSALGMGLLQSYTEPSIYIIKHSISIIKHRQTLGSVKF